MKILTILLCFAVFTASSQQVPKQRYDALQKQYNDLKKENQTMKVKLNKPSKWSVGYAFVLTPDSGHLALNQLSHDFHVGYDLKGCRLVSTFYYDWQFTQASLSGGSEAVLFHNQSFSFGTFGNIGVNIGDDKTAFFNWGFSATYGLSKKVSLHSAIKQTYYSSQDGIKGITMGANYHF